MAEEILTCAHCGGMITPRINKTTGLPSKAARKFCSTRCADSFHDSIKPKGRKRDSKFKPVHCRYCHKDVPRRIRGSADALKYCSRDCAFGAINHMRREREALVRIAHNIRAVARNIAKAQRADDRAKARASVIATKLIRTCMDCDEAFSQRTHMGTPEKRCVSCEAILLRAARRASKLLRKARSRGAKAESIDPIKVFERDKWKCHLCGIKTLKSMRGTYDDRAPELEHIVSFADGGSHTWGNVACSCRKCNGVKGARSIGQIGISIAA